MGENLPFFRNVENYNPTNSRHRAEMRSVIGRHIAKIWNRKSFGSMTEATEYAHRLSAWFCAAGLNAFIPQIDFEAAVMDALRDNYNGDRRTFGLA